MSIKKRFQMNEPGDYHNPVGNEGPRGHVRIAQFKPFFGPAKRIVLDKKTELCGTCRLRYECYYPYHHISVDTCLDYSPEEFTRICPICRNLTFLNLNTGRCNQCGSLMYSTILPTVPPK